MRKSLIVYLFLSVVTIGLAYLLNRFAIESNGGYMPVKSLVEGVMVQGRAIDGIHSVMTGLTKYHYLCDIIEIPGVAILSIGDILAYTSFIFPIRWLLI